MADMTGYGLAEATWGEADASLGPFVASPADVRGRGLALTVARDGTPVDLTGLTVTLLWRHREARLRGTADFELSAPQLGACRICWPRAMAAHEGAVDAQVAIIGEDGSVMSSLPFEIRVVMALEGGGDGEEEGVSSLLAAAADARTAAAELRAAAARGDFDGEDGAPGADGVSPAVTIERTSTGALVTISDSEGTTTATIADGAKGDPFTYDDFTSEQLESLRGPAGPEGSLESLKYFPDELSMCVVEDWVYADPGTVEPGDLVISVDGTLARIDSIVPGAQADDEVKAYITKMGGFRGRCLSISSSELMDADPGEEVEPITTLANGVFPCERDLILNTATGCLLEIKKIYSRYPACASVRAEGICRFATREYVDQAIAALDDLSEVEF